MDRILKLQTAGPLPRYETEGSAGLDLPCALHTSLVVQPGEMVQVPTGIRAQIPEGTFGLVVPRSSTGIKRRLMLANTLGVIDSDYRGEILVFLVNVGSEAVMIEPGDRLAQMILLPYIRAHVIEGQVDETERGQGGFGSTGR